jgi:hypothetical protein
MGRKSSVDDLTDQLDDLRDRAAGMLESDGRSGGSTWPRRLAWVGLGVAIGAAASGGRLLKMLPTQLAARVQDATDQLASVASGLTDQVTSFVGDPAGDATSAVDETIDVTDEVAGMAGR